MVISWFQLLCCSSFSKNLFQCDVLRMKSIWESSMPPGGGGNLSFQDTGLCHSSPKIPPINPEKFVKSIPINLEDFLKIIPINPEMPKQLTNK